MATSRDRVLDRLLAPSAPRSPVPTCALDIVVPRLEPPTVDERQVAHRALVDIATGVSPASPARVRAAIEVLDRAPEVPVAHAEMDLTTPEGEAELVRVLEALPARLLLEALERQRVAPMGEGRVVG